MLYSEFVEGTGCRDNAHNMNVYKRLEIVYMNDDSMTKEEVYEWGKKLVNNDLSEEQKAQNKKLKEEIEYWNEQYESYRSQVDTYKEYAKTSVLSEDRKYWNGQAKWYADMAAEAKVEIKKRKFCIIK
jgi:hypothetical protein